jgi:CMP-N-acetylneuraminic acid synthetase
VGGYQEEFSCQDGYDIWLKVINRYKPYNVNNPLFYYRQHADSLTRNQKKILDTRRQIKRQFAEKIRNGEKLKVLGIIPVIKHSIYSQSAPFVELAGKPLLWYTLNELQYTGVLDRVLLASDDGDILAYGQNFPEIEPFKRPSKYSKTITNHADIFKYILATLREREKYEPDAVCILYITTPLRKARHIEKAIDTMIIFGLDSIISVDQELAPCYRRGRFGLAPIRNSRRIMRIEREAIYKENGAIHISRSNIINDGRLLGDTIGHVIMLPEESIKIASEFDLWMAEKIINEWRGRDKLS